jgi:hypothetical protein
MMGHSIWFENFSLLFEETASGWPDGNGSA